MSQFLMVQIVWMNSRYYVSNIMQSYPYLYITDTEKDLFSVNALVLPIVADPVSGKWNENINSNKAYCALKPHVFLPHL